MKFMVYIKYILTVTFIFFQLKCICQYNLEDFISKSTYKYKTFGDIHLTAENNFFYKTNGDYIVKYDFRTGNIIDTLFNYNSYKIEISNKFNMSNNGQSILLLGETKSLFRYSTLAKYYIYNCITKKLTSVSDTAFLRLAEISPNNNFVSFVKDNNLYVQNIKDGQIKQITNDGRYNYIINGAPDWVYEEEFTLKKAFEWSPDGKYIAYIKFDETNVKTYPIITYANNIYPKVNYLKYPKAGETNSKVSVYIYNTSSNTTKKIDIGTDTNRYIPRIRWNLTSSILGIVRMNRQQNQLDILFANPENGTSKQIYHEQNKKYIDELPEKYPLFIDDDNDFLITSEQEGYNQIYLLKSANNRITQITKGNFDIRGIYGFNKSTKKIFYSASENSPMQTEVYSISEDGNNKCLTLNKGTNTPVFNNNFQFFINEYSSHNIPFQYTLQNSEGKILNKLLNNTELEQKINNYHIPLKEFLNFYSTEGINLNGWMIKPADFDSTKKYPVVMYVYGGPSLQTVLDEWQINWANYLATKGIIVVSIDGRGTPGRGEAFKKITYKNLGYYETIDQIETAKYLAKLSYIESNKISIFGWSYGGYMSAMCILKGCSIFNAAVAVAPVTDWRFYDSVYTERYMDLPENNPNGYIISSPNEYADSLKGKFLLIHGTDDDNVHFQNSLALVNAMVNANKQFDMQVYPDKNHNIAGANTTMHIYKRITDFLIYNILK
jgi:dipeptidyl-peptidase-4